MSVTETAPAPPQTPYARVTIVVPAGSVTDKPEYVDLVEVEGSWFEPIVVPPRDR